jgi:hypothetical protein
MPLLTDIYGDFMDAVPPPGQRSFCDLRRFGEEESEVGSLSLKPSDYHYLVHKMRVV